MTRSKSKGDPWATDCTFRDLVIHNHNHHYNLARHDTVYVALGAVEPYKPPPEIPQPVYVPKPRPATPPPKP